MVASFQAQTRARTKLLVCATESWAAFGLPFFFLPKSIPTNIPSIIEYLTLETHAKIVLSQIPGAFCGFRLLRQSRRHIGSRYVQLQQVDGVSQRRSSQSRETDHIGHRRHAKERLHCGDHPASQSQSARKA